MKLYILKSWLEITEMLLRHNNKLMRFEFINCTGRGYDNNVEAINAVVFVANMKTGYEVISRF